MAAPKFYTGLHFSGADSKVRFTLPANLRHRVKAGGDGENLLHIAMSDERPHMIGFGTDHFDEINRRIEDRARVAIERGDDFDEHAAARLEVADIETVTFDEGGRFGLAEDVREIMGIDDVLVFVGIMKTFEIWTADNFMAFAGTSRTARHRCALFVEQHRAKSGARSKRA